MGKIVTVIGARPQFIKAAPVSRSIRKHLDEVLVDTGQHYDFKMAGVFFDELNIPKPDYNLGVGSGTHGKQTGEMLLEIEKVLQTEKPNAVLIYGDTNSTLAASIAASKMHIPVYHVEAGLRSYNRKMPEEINRVMADHVSSLLFAPTETAVNNLFKEGVTEGVHNVGDVMYDAFLYNLNIAQGKYNIEDFDLQRNQYILATIHRAENTDDPDRLGAIVKSLVTLQDNIIIPLHPRTKKCLEDQGLMKLVEEAGHVKLIDPVSYLEMLILQRNAKRIITDSGGVQKEAYFAKVPCFTVREQTEWVETVESGWNKLVNPINDDLKYLLEEQTIESNNDNLYGDGNASEIINKIILDTLK